MDRLDAHRWARRLREDRAIQGNCATADSTSGRSGRSRSLEKPGRHGPEHGVVGRSAQQLPATASLRRVWVGHFFSSAIPVVEDTELVDVLGWAAKRASWRGGERAASGAALRRPGNTRAILNPISPLAAAPGCRRRFASCTRSRWSPRAAAKGPRSACRTGCTTMTRIRGVRTELCPVATIHS